MEEKKGWLQEQLEKREQAVNNWPDWLKKAAGVKESKPENKIVFADERAKTAWEVGEAVKKLLTNLPPENPQMDSRQIRFVSEYEVRGFYAILFSGTVVFTDKKGEYLVPDRTVYILEQMGIPFIQT